MDQMLIKYVENFPNLYDRKHEDYACDKIKEQSWWSIAQSLDADPESTKRRWTNLRDRFVRENRLRKEEASIDPGSLRKRPKFQHYDLMSWLTPYLRKSNMVLSGPFVRPKYSSDTSQSSITEGMKVEDPLIELEIDIPEGNFEMVEDGILSPAPSSTSTNRTSAANTSKKDDVKDSTQCALSAFSKFLEQKVQPDKTSSDMHFMKSIVGDMAMLSPTNRVKFKKDVMELLVQYIDNESD